MLSESVAVDFLLSDLDRFLGRRVRVHGVFALKNDEGYLVAAPELRETKQMAILIDVAALRLKLLPLIPPLGGGAFYYLHEASVVGKVANCTSGPYACTLRDVQELAVNASGESFLVHFAGETQ